MPSLATAGAFRAAAWAFEEVSELLEVSKWLGHLVLPGPHLAHQARSK